MRVVLPVVKFSIKKVELGQRHKKYVTETTQKSRKKIYVALSALFILLLVGLLIKHTLSSPNEGQIATPVLDSSPTPKIAEYQTLTTSFYSLAYPGRYSEEPTDINPSGVLDYKVLSHSVSSQSAPSKIEITIKQAPDGGITLDSSYDYYQKHQAQYKLSNQLSRGEIIDIARNINGSPETSGMWLHNSFLMIVKITTPDRHENIDTELKGVLSSVQWQQ